MLIPAISGTKSIIAAAKSEPSVEHLIITSSFAAVADLSQAQRPGYTYTAKDFNPASKYMLMQYIFENLSLFRSI